MAKKKDVNIDELDDESGKSGKLVSILVAMLNYCNMACYICTSY